jgi:FkbM family methyltransferase
MSIFWHSEAKLWWPEEDHNPVTAYAYVMRHLPDVDRTIARCKQRRTVVQAGAHVGLWPMRLAKKFNRVITFEVQPASYEACKLNFEKYPNIEIYNQGLGSSEQDVRIRRSASAGGWRVDEDGDRWAHLVTVDSFNLQDCDALILDIEGYEVAALTGAAETIRRCKPVIHLEELPRSKASIQAYMRLIGYKPVERIHKDCIYAI